jgi:preprotein translocase subunit YajC
MNKDHSRIHRALLLLLALLLLMSLAACAPQENVEASTTMSPNDFLFSTINFICMAMIVYFLLVLNPAKARDEKQRGFIEKLAKGDEVVTSSGIFGKVASIKPNHISVEIAPNVKIRVDPKHLHEVAAGSLGSSNDAGKSPTSIAAASGKSGNSKKKKS